MIDLEALAIDRARALSQSEAEWLEPIKSTFVDAACRVLSDGDIRQIFSLSISPSNLYSSFQAIAKASTSDDENAVSVCMNSLKTKATVSG